MASYGADDLKNFWNNIIPTSLTVTPWEVKLAKKIFADTGDTKLKSIAGAQGWNTVYIDRLNKLSKDKLLPGANRWIYMNSNGPATDEICQSFFNHINDPDIKEKPFSITGILVVENKFLIVYCKMFMVQ
jgi:hypothetical protein